MPLRSWTCPKCGEGFTTKKDMPEHCEGVKAELAIKAPATKFMEKVNEEHGKSALKDQQKILKERARTYSRDHEIIDLVSMNDAKTAKDNGWIKPDGSFRKKIDDL